MSRTEDYLDSLLNTVSNGTAGKARQNKNKMESVKVDQYLHEFEGELFNSRLDENADDFLHEFEMELDGGEEDEIPQDEMGNPDFFQELDGIVNKAKNKIDGDTGQGASSKKSSVAKAAPKEDAQKAQAKKNQSTPVDPDIPDMIIPENPLPVGADVPVESSEEKDLLDMLSDLPDDDELSNIGELLRANDEEVPVTPAAEETAEDGMEKPLGAEPEESAKEPVNPEGATEPIAVDMDALDLEEKGAGKDKKKKKKDKSGGFLAKLAKILFGEDEEEVLEQAVVPESVDLENLTEENLRILQELEEAEKESKNGNTGKSKKDKKKKEKKEKKEKQAKVKKEKKPKAPRPKKEKKPKVVDTSPPLPRGPVILIFVMAASMFLLVMLLTNLLNGSRISSDAKSAFAQGNYVEAYTQLAGTNPTGNDAVLFEKAGLLARVQEKYIAYDNLMYAKEYTMALDSLICALGRCEVNYPDAQIAGIATEYDTLRASIIEQLKDQFGVSQERAMELYEERDREVYSRTVADMINELGMEEEE